MLTPMKPSQTILSILSHQPFDLIDFDVIGPIFPLSEEGHRYILVIIEYLTRKVRVDALLINSGEHAAIVQNGMCLKYMDIP